MNEAKAERKRRYLWRLLQRIGWRDAGDHTIRYRVYRLALERHPWWDWGHRVMVLTGTPMGGNFQEPSPPTLWYRWDAQQLVLTKSYKEYRAATESMTENDWKWIGLDQDHELRLGYYQSGNFYGLPRAEQRLLFWWLVRWRFRDWFGLRTWLYFKGLHAAVNRKVPFTCQAVPPKGGGYSHWHCHLKRKHVGMHRFNNYVWGDIEGEPISAYHPVGR
jgi:hypothetical protein